MITVKFKDGIGGSVHHGVWTIMDLSKLKLARAVTESVLLEEHGYIPYRDYFIATEVLKVIPGEITDAGPKKEELDERLIY